MNTPPPKSPGLDQAAALARGLKPIARFVCVASLVAAGWMSYVLHGWWHLATGGTATAATLLGLPALLYAWLWWLLYALGELPQRLYGAVGTFKEIADRPAAPAGAGGFGKLGRALGDLWRVLDETDSVMLPLSAAVLLANPIGLMVLGVGFAYGAVLWLVAAIVALTRIL